MEHVPRKGIFCSLNQKTYFPVYRRGNDEPNISDYERSFGDEEFAVCVILGNGVCDTHRDYRLPSIDFLDDQFGIRKVLTVSEVGKPMWTHDSVQFFLRFALHLWTADHGKDKRVEGRNSL